MKTKHVKNTGQMVWRGQIVKLPGGGAKGANCQGRAKGATHCTGWALLLLLHSHSPPLIVGLIFIYSVGLIEGYNTKDRRILLSVIKIEREKN